MTRLLLALAPAAAAIALITFQVLTTRHRQKREDREAAARFEQQVAQALAACRDEDEFRPFAEQQSGTPARTVRRPQ